MTHLYAIWVRFMGLFCVDSSVLVGSWQTSLPFHSDYLPRDQFVPYVSVGPAVATKYGLRTCPQLAQLIPSRTN
jgi:hypothetical protein